MPPAMWRDTPGPASPLPYASRHAERDREQATGECECQHEACCLAQRRPECACNFKQWNQQQEADGQMHGERMKAAEELLPVCVRLAIEPEQPRQQNE